MENSQNKIQFGIMCRGTVFPEWQADSIKELLKINNVECNLLIIDDRNFAKKPGFFSNIKPRHYLWKIFMYLNKNRFQSTSKVDMTDEFSEVQILKCKVKKEGKFSEYFDPKDIEKIKNQNLHFILRYGFGIIRGEILESAEYGVWSFHHDDEQKYRGGPPGFWEIYKKDNISAAILQRLTDKLDAGVILKKGYLKTKTSYPKNRDQLYRESARWPALVCKSLMQGNVDIFNKLPSNTTANIFTVPVNHELMGFLILNLLRQIKNKLKNWFYMDYWEIGIVEAPISKFLDSKPEVKWLPGASKHRFRADPFGIQTQDGIKVFYEEFTYKKGKGTLESLGINNTDSGYSKVLEKPFHLSYPFLLQEGGKCYMIPESCGDGNVVLYEAEGFPFKWTRLFLSMKDCGGCL